MVKEFQPGIQIRRRQSGLPENGAEAALPISRFKVVNQRTRPIGRIPSRSADRN